MIFLKWSNLQGLLLTLDASNHLLRYKDKSFYNEDAYLVDSTFFDIFNFHFINGNATNALTEPNSIVLLKQLLINCSIKKILLAK